ncbi:HK97 family phage major capsid protein [Burkholderia pseudomallei]|uniref:phage major capsid protein n=1 Tax=Burkholderia pseudomallei TaxID=28450 RepID=UPI000977CE57|nr:phage major capsid protein [Burkholderia pseudomallei]OMR93324.1 capsid protein [Burkholderia pseudomallei]OMS09929.1 capsid protein [Burkholderia pseudomallei]CAJ7028835.1 HK97 family phage major capsid protein [Burkholderia pseudomallei]CAJ7358541.1 HK97 family phage major capsid protein [Burkholderia pseudomallei]VBJ26782.1 HK97 family phage major capsid protein [Burkholderia pseudomallei]
MNKQIRALQQRKAKLVAEMREIVTAANASADGNMTDEQVTQFDALRAQVEAINAQIEREELMAANEVASGVEIADDARIDVSDNRLLDPRRGWKSVGEFAQAVRAAAPGYGTRPDERLLIGAAAPSTFGNEAGGQDGGFLVPPEYSAEIFTLSLEEDALLPRTDTTPVSGNSMVFPKDETTPWGTDGIRAYWQAEASVANATKPKLGVATRRLHKLMALVPITDELLDDTNALTAYLPKKTAASIRWKTDEAILFGTGAGQPWGVMNSKALVVVPKDTGQATMTLSSKNIINMVSLLPAGSYGRSFWLMNPDVLPLLDQLALGQYPIYMPTGGGVRSMEASPYGMLKGRPIITSEHAAQVSTQADISLLDLSYYQSITSRGGVQTATSLHLYFDADATAFRTTFRVDGAPKLENPITPPKSQNKRSPFIALAAR